MEITRKYENFIFYESLDKKILFFGSLNTFLASEFHKQWRC